MTAAGGLSVLVAEDEPSHAEAIVRSLRRDLPGAEVRTVPTLAGFRAQAALRPPGVALVDLNLPDGSASEVLSVPPEAAPFPVVVMTAYGDERMAVEALKAGALDYMVKSPEAFSAIARTVQRVHDEWSLLRERRRADEERRRHLAEAEARERRMEALLRAMRAVLDLNDVGEVAQRVLETARDAVGADAGCLRLPETQTAAGAPCLADLRGLVFRLDPGRFPEEPADAVRLENGLPAGARTWKLPAGPVEVRSLLLAPLHAGSGSGGLLALANKRPGFTQDDAALAGALAETMALAVARAADRRALEASEEKYRALFDSLSDVVIIRTLDGRFLAVNKAVEDAYGYTREELLRMEVRDLHPPDTREEGDSKVHEVTEKGHAIFQTEHLTRSGRRIPVEIHASRILYGGRPAVLSVIRDITERKRAEEALRASEEQLRQERKIDSIGRLAGGVAHDLNNLLVPILGYSEILQNRMPPEDPRRPAVDQIRKAAERSRDLTWRLLAFGRRQIFELHSLDLRQVLEGFGKLLRRTIREDIDIRIVMPKTLSRVRADAGQIEQVLMNLAVNAQDAMPQGGTLRMELADVDWGGAAAVAGLEPGPYVALTVTDTGCGMEAAVLDRIFEPFFTTKAVGRGTGLGLPTAYGIVKQHHGEILARSAPGQGSTFSVYLPAETEAASAGGVSAPVAEDAAPRGSETLLVVEDSEPVRVIACQMLEDLGYRVFSAAGAVSMPRALEEAGGSPDLLITDVVMPGCNGRDLFRLVAALRPGIRVLYMSGYTDDAIVHHGVLDEGVALLHKPFTQAMLAAKVREVLDQPARDLAPETGAEAVASPGAEAAASSGAEAAASSGAEDAASS